LKGGAGADTLIAGSGACTLSGGAGADVFSFSTLPSKVDRISDFQVGVDRIDLTKVLTNYHGADPVADHYVSFASDGNGGTYVTEDGTPCYCRGTLILTDKGEVPVEDLRIGHKVVTNSGHVRPIRWIGTRSYSGRFTATNPDVLPIRIKAGALGDGVPKRDLMVSPLHAMFIDHVLIPAYALVNGVSISRDRDISRVDYFHIELDSHDVVLAEGAPAETFVDDDSRGMFHNAREYRALYPDAVRTQPHFCAPIVEDGKILQDVRDLIWTRAKALEAGAPADTAQIA